VINPLSTSCILSTWKQIPFNNLRFFKLLRSKPKLLKRYIPAGKDISLADKDISLADKDISLADKDISLANKDISLADKDISLAGKGISLADKESHLLYRQCRLWDHHILPK
jgi:hypothetical protein